MRNHSNENEFDLHASENNFHMNGFALRLILKKRQKSTQKWPIDFFIAVSQAVKLLHLMQSQLEHLELNTNSAEVVYLIKVKKNILRNM